MINHAKALALINRLVEKFGKGGYIFRGTTKRYSLQKGEGKIRDGINSNLYRWVVKDEKEGEISDEQENLNKIFSENEHFFPSDLEKEIVNSASRMFQSNTAEHEILTELQHFGGKTNMIDFSRNMYVALFFACQGNFNESGELIALREDDEKLKKIKEINYGKRPEKGALEIIDPAGAQNSRQRVHFQSSVFVRPADGYINPKECEKFRICGKLKKPLSEYLRVFHNLTKDTIYNDLHGFISNERNNETASLYFYMGLANTYKSDHKKAAVYYGKCIERNPSETVAYNNRGNAYDELKQRAAALRDYNKAISINPNYADAYHNRGNLYINFKNFDIAIEDFNKALSINPNLAPTYNSRGFAYTRLGQEKLAIEDFNKAISINPNYVEAHVNRGIAKIKIGDKEGSNADFAKAKELQNMLPESMFPPKK